MQDHTHIQGWDNAAQGNLRAQCQVVASEIGEALVSQIKSLVPPEWNVSYDVEPCPDTHSDVMLEVFAKDDDGIRQINFRTGFDFPAHLSWIENFSVITDRGTGLGRSIFSMFVREASDKGITKANLTSTDIGSYFWITQDVEPSNPSGLAGKIDLRLDVLEQWLPPETIQVAKGLLSQAKDDAQKLRDLAQLDFRTEIAQAFAGLAYQADLARRETEGWTNGFMDEVAAELEMIVQKRDDSQTPKLGHLLLVNTRWSGSLALPPRNG